MYVRPWLLDQFLIMGAGKDAIVYVPYKYGASLVEDALFNGYSFEASYE